MRSVACVLLLAGCSSGANVAAQAIDSAEVAAAEAALLASDADSVTDSLSANLSTNEDTANASASLWPQLWAPPGCVVSTVQGGSVTSVFNDCSGPYGLDHVSGTVIVGITPQTQSANGDSTAAIVAEGVGFGADGAVFDIQAAATYQKTADKKTLTVTTQAVAATGAHGTALTRQGSYDATWTPDGCLTLDGAWQNVVDSRIAQLTVTGYKRCPGMCPASGATIVSTMVSGSLFGNGATDVSFDGSSKATFTGSTGHGTVPLFCN